AEQLGGLRAIRREDGFPQGYETVTARVIARSPTVWYSAIQINAGSRDGVREDQPVITGDGLIGKVTTVTGGTARVELITNQGSAVSAQIMPVGANGIVKPEVGNPRDLLLEFVQKGRRVRRGQTVVTSGFTSSKVDSLFPRGIPVGKVSRVEPDEVELYQRVHIEPYADLRRTDFVDVLIARDGERAKAP
ncbi:MAG: rod shape-determining protein MreC, partial [Thermoleophilaceae bacterium]|nr:rod shape-determining protein MreC [Thermoleophilaceae bacterium]